jgi:endonuclease/exonuclease/phosphatase family metal-dependent hydrolase
MTFRFGSWNVNRRRLTADHVDLLSRAGCDVVALQEVSAEFHAALASQPLFHWSVSSFSLRAPGPTEGRARRMGCSIFGRSPFRLVAAGVLAHLAFPERTVVIVAETDTSPFTFASFHTPPGANWGEIKPATLKAIAEWLAERQGRVVMGIDANAPKVDHPNPDESEWWWDDEALLLGPSPRHPLREVLRVFLEDRPDIMASLRAERPRGPLATSHFRGRGVKRTACRYDFIYASSHFAVDEVTYLMDEAVKAGSDHALVIAQLRDGEPLSNSSQGRALSNLRSKGG